MNVTAENIWSVPAYLPYLQPPLTDEAITKAEAEIGFSLPTAFLNLLWKQNGGYIRFSLPDSTHDKIAGIGPYFPSLTGFDWDDCQEYVGFPLQGLVPFDGDGHWYLCLDYRSNPNSPAITCADIECDDQLEVAKSFDDYLSLLRIDVEDEFVFEALPTFEAAIANLSSTLGVTFGDPDLWSYGYPTYRAALGTKSNPQWLWISPNRVIRGFVRSDDPRFDELKDLMPGWSLRYPELGESSFIVSSTDGARSRVFDAFASNRIQLRPLRELIRGV